MPITEHPLHRSVRALLMHTAPTLGDDAHSPERIGVMEFNLRKPKIDNLFHLFPWQLATVAPATQGPPPHLRDGKAEGTHGLLIVGNSVVSAMSLDHTLQPLSLLFDRMMHSLSHLLLQFLQFSSHLFPDCSSEDRVHTIAALYSYDVSEAKEVKSFWLVLTSAFSVLNGPWAKLQNTRLFWVKLKTKLEHSFPQFLQIIFSLEFMFKSHHKIVGPSHNDNFTVRFIHALVIHPQIQSVMKIDVCKQGTDAPTLRNSFISFCVSAFNQYARLQPFPDQTDHTIITNPVFNKFDQPLVVKTVKEPLDVCVQDPIYFTGQKSNVKCIETVVLTSPRSITKGERPEIIFVDGVHDFDGGPLDKLVLKYRNTQRALLSIGLINEYPANWLRFVSSRFQSLGQVLKVSLQVFFVIFPRYFVDSCRCTFLHFKETFAQPIHTVNMVHQVVELNPFLSLSEFTYAIQRTLHVVTGLLCPRHVLLFRFPFGQRLSLHPFRHWLNASFVQRLRRYFVAVRLPVTVHHRRTPHGFSMRALSACAALASHRISRFSRRLLRVRSRKVSDPARFFAISPLRLQRCCPQAHFLRAWTSGFIISGLNTWHSHNPVNASRQTLPPALHDSSTPSLAKRLEVKFLRTINTNLPVYPGAQGNIYAKSTNHQCNF